MAKREPQRESDRDDSSLFSAVKRVLATSKERKSAPYDGVLGMPPTWVPDPLVAEFMCYRDELLDRKHSPEEIQAWRRARAKETGITFDGEEGLWIGSYPLDIRHELDALNYIEHIASLGEQRGIAVYLGKSAEAVYRGAVSDRQRTIAKQPRTNALRRCVEGIVRDNLSVTWKECLKELSRRDHRISVTDNSITWQDDNGRSRSTSVQALKDVVSRAKVRIHDSR